MSNFQNSKVPPTGGSHLPHAHPSSFEMRRTAPVPTRGARDGTSIAGSVTKADSTVRTGAPQGTRASRLRPRSLFSPHAAAYLPGRLHRAARIALVANA
jgi:hypothetical protein